MALRYPYFNGEIMVKWLRTMYCFTAGQKICCNAATLTQMYNSYLPSHKA